MSGKATTSCGSIRYREEPDSTSGARRVSLRAASLSLLAFLSVLAAPTPAHAQKGAKSLDSWFGVSSPKGDLGDVNDSGWATGIGFGYRLMDRVELRLDGTLERTVEAPAGDLFKEEPGPDAYLWHATASVALEVTEPGSFGEISVSGGAGLSHIEVKAFRDFSEIVDRAPTLTGAIFAGVEPAEWLTLFTRIRYYVMLEEGEREFEQAPLGREATLINSLGVRFSF